MVTLKRSHASVFEIRRGYYKWVNKQVPFRPWSTSTISRATRWKAKNERADSTRASRTEVCQARIIPGIWRRTAKAEYHYAVIDSATMIIRSHTRFLTGGNVREHSNEDRKTILIQGDSTWILTASSDGGYDSSLSVYNDLDLLITYYKSYSVGSDTSAVQEFVTFTYDHAKHIRSEQRIDRSPFSPERTTLRTCSCGEGWRTQRCSMIGTEGKEISSRFEYDSENVLRKTVVRRGKKVLSREVYRYRKYKS